MPAAPHGMEQVAFLRPFAIVRLTIRAAIVALVSLPLLVVAVRLQEFVVMSVAATATLLLGVLAAKAALLVLLERALKRVSE